MEKSLLKQIFYGIYFLFSSAPLFFRFMVVFYFCSDKLPFIFYIVDSNEVLLYLLDFSHLKYFCLDFKC